MKARYITIYKIHGANKLPDDSERASLLALQSPALTATLTTNPEPDLLHLDKSAALLKGVFALDKEGHSGRAACRRDRRR